MTETVKSAVGWLNFVAGRLRLLSQLVTAFLVLAFVGMALETREPPFVQLPHEPIQVRAGKWADLRLPVRRDMNRRCTVHYYRTLIDADGSRFDLPGGAEVPEGVRRNHARTPGVLPVMLLVPSLRTEDEAGIDAGPAILKSTRQWSCNPVQELFPIRDDSEALLYVLP